MKTPQEFEAPSLTQDPHAHSTTTPYTDPAPRSGNKGAHPTTKPTTSAASQATSVRHADKDPEKS